MGFWDGLGKAMESNEQQRNVETARSDRQDELDKSDARYDAALTIDAEKWKNTLAEQTYRKGQDTLAIKREDKKINDARIFEMATLGGTVKTSTVGTRTNSNSSQSTASGTEQELKQIMSELSSFGATEANNLNISGNGNQVALDTLNAYKTINALAGKDSNSIDVNDFLRSATIVTTPGEPFDLAKVAEAKGLSLDDVNSYAGLAELMAKMYTQTDLSTINFGMTYNSPMDIDEFGDIADAIKGNMIDDLNNEIKILRGLNGTPEQDPDKLRLLGDAVTSLKGDNPSYESAFNLLGDKVLLPFLDNQRFMETKFGGEVGRARDRLLASQNSSVSVDSGVDQSVRDNLVAFDMTEADIPRFTQEEYLSAEEGPGTPYFYIDGVLQVNKELLNKPPTERLDLTIPPDNTTDPVMDQTNSAFSSRQPGDDSSPRGITTEPETKSYEGEAGSTYTSFFTGRPTMSDGPSLRMTEDETAAYNDMTVPQDTPERGSIFPTRGERAEANAASPNEYETPAPMQRATDERSTRLDARAERNASKIEQEDGQLLLEYILEETTNPDMLEAMSQEFKAKYGEEALMSLVEEANAFQQRFFMQKGKTPFWEK
tara:strand:- start:1059 stop:2864 length:1806 start_codon:yes stop_codon:yes gene_type:complete